MDYNHFIKLIKEKRLKLNMTQNNIAKMIPMSRTSYNKFETGKREPTMFQIVRLCKILKIDFTKEFKIFEDDKKHHEFD